MLYTAAEGENATKGDNEGARVPRRVTWGLAKTEKVVRIEKSTTLPYVYLRRGMLHGESGLLEN